MSQVAERQSGAVMALVAIFLTVIFGMAALAVELVMYASSLQQAKTNANLAALAAIEESTTGEKETAIGRALSRANEVLGLNVVLAQKGSAAPQELNSTQANVTLEPGFWYYEKPTNGSDPCGLSGSTYPCFVARESGNTDRPNAFQIIGELFPPMPFTFARAAFGVQPLPVRVDSVATIVPRRGCFLVDISPSTLERETHLLQATNPWDRAEMAFYLTNPPDNASGPQTHHNGLWASWEDSAHLRVTRPTGPVDPLIHYQSDFERTDTLIPGGLLSDADWDETTYGKQHPSPFDSGGGTNSYSIPSKPIYRVDVFPRDGQYPAVTTSGGQYRGPEPMSTVFQGLHRAVEIFEERAVVGDQMCVIFYDQSLHWTKVFKLTDDFKFLKDLTDLSERENPDKGLKLAIKHRIFPGYGSQTDTLNAVAEAMKEFDGARTANPGVPTSDFIVLLGDGLVTCQSCPPRPSPLPFDTNSDGIIDDTDKTAFNSCYNGVTPAGSCGWADSNGDGSVEGDTADEIAFNDAYTDPYNYCNFTGKNCNNHFSNYMLGMHELKNYVRSEVASSKVPIHVVAIGAHVGPHTVSHQDTSTNPPRCLNDYESRAKGYNSVMPMANSSGDPFSCWADHTTKKIVCDSEGMAAFNSRNAENPFYQVNADLYDIAKMTGGLWGPLRPADSGCTAEEQTKGKCAAEGTIVTTDPYCRTPSQQMEKYMEEIMGQNPFTVTKQ